MSQARLLLAAALIAALATWAVGQAPAPGPVSVGGLVQTTGTWTPALAFGGSTTGITYTTQQGDWTRVGNMITVRFTILLSSKGAQTGNATISGLPFATNNGGNRFGGTWAFGGGMAVSSSMVFSVAPGATTIDIFDVGAQTTISNTAFTNTSNVQGTITYFL
jgi:hypothetical protein